MLDCLQGDIETQHFVDFVGFRKKRAISDVKDKRRSKNAERHKSYSVNDSQRFEKTKLPKIRLVNSTSDEFEKQTKRKQKIPIVVLDQEVENDTDDYLSPSRKSSAFSKANSQRKWNIMSFAKKNRNLEPIHF